MADPLKVLREYAVGRRTLRELKHGDDHYFLFGDIAYPRGAKTNLPVYGKQNEYYSLESLYLLWENRNLQHTAYVKDASGKGIQCVTRPDRRELLAYLKGEREQPPHNINLLAPMPAPIPLSRLVEQLEPESKKSRFDGEESRLRIQNLLRGGVTDPGMIDSKGVRDLSDKLTADKIAALKHKRMKNMARNTIKSVDDSFPLPAEMDVSEVTADLIVREQKGMERVWRNRTNILESGCKDFTPILSLLHSYKTRQNPENHQKMAPPVSRPVANDRARPQSFGYSRYDQERFNKDQTAGFKIETGLTFQGTSLQTISSGAKPLDSASTVNKYAASVNYMRPSRRQSRTPIIVIPSTGTSLITMYNVRDILQDMRFVSTEERKATMRRENEVLVQRVKEGGTTVPYRVVENPLKLTEEEWDRIVAVFVQGPAWQFKGWKWAGNPIDIFANLAAFHIMFDDQRMDPNVAKWSVNILKLSRTKRHLDHATLFRFWEILDQHIAKTKSYLRY